MQVDAYARPTLNMKSDNFLQVLRYVQDTQAAQVTRTSKEVQSQVLTNLSKYMSYIKSTLEHQGYGVVVRCKHDAVVQIDVDWKGLKLLSSVRSFTDHRVILSMSTGLEKGTRIGEDGQIIETQVSHNSFTDFMRAELEVLASLEVAIQGDVQGHGSAKWLQRHIPDAKDLCQGQLLNLCLIGKREDLQLVYGLEDILEEAKQNAISWNPVIPSYIQVELSEETDRVAYADLIRSDVRMLTETRNLDAPEASVAYLDNIIAQKEMNRAAELQKEKDTRDSIQEMLDGWDDLDFGSPVPSCVVANSVVSPRELAQAIQTLEDTTERIDPFADMTPTTRLKI